ncbi:MAG: DUF4190 domain-containing protein [Candidatus Dormibacteraeota bacterium]|nr:DUF4190 domain-containing protein [Candidatus Dormibacteraeota bacterium]
MQQSPEDPPRMVPPGPPGRGGVMSVSRPTNRLAIVSLVAGIAGYAIPHPFIAGLVAIVTGHLARGQIRRTGEGGALLATIGLILGYVHLFLSVLLVGLIIIVALGFGAYIVSQGHNSG